MYLRYYLPAEEDQQICEMAKIKNITYDCDLKCTVIELKGFNDILLKQTLYEHNTFMDDLTYLMNHGDHRMITLSGDVYEFDDEDYTDANFMEWLSKTHTYTIQ